MTTADDGWFAGVDPDDVDGAAARIRNGRADRPRDWPAQAVESGFATTESDYYDRLHAASLAATRDAVETAERADDQQLVHAVRAMDDLAVHANEVAERAVEWAGSRFSDVGTGIEGARAVAEREPANAVDERVIGVAETAAALADERDALRAFVERTAPEVAPNLATLAGPVLAARLIALAGGLESLAKKPSGTVQVLGAEDALFAHLAGRAPSPKHGVIYTHEAVRGAPPDRRGTVARALAGKLAIAARIDHYAGDRRPELEDDLAERLAQIRGEGTA